jgi:hypothetical protein
LTASSVSIATHSKHKSIFDIFGSKVFVPVGERGNTDTLARVPSVEKRGKGKKRNK